jgi:hypothetical protein
MLQAISVMILRKTIDTFTSSFYIIPNCGICLKINGVRQKAARTGGIELHSKALGAPQGRAPSHSSGHPASRRAAALPVRKRERKRSLPTAPSAVAAQFHR